MNLENAVLDERAMGDIAHRPDLNFWRGLALGQLWLSRCVKCSTFLWPAPWRCKHCGSFEIGWEQVDARGTVYSWTRTHYPFVPGYTDLLPYVNVLVELPHADDRRLFGLLRGDQVRIGQRVQGVFEPASPDTAHLPTLRWELT